jgi:hypothetical protein
MNKSRRTAEYGDFQTPEALARHVCAVLHRQNVQPSSLVEPTCGLGAFLFAGLDRFPLVESAIGSDINPAYIQHVAAVLSRRHDSHKTRLIEADFFRTNWEKMLTVLPEPILVLGNLPWVTNSHLGAIGSRNLPDKSNFQNHEGLDAITGKANFDISEWMLLRLLQALHGRNGTLAMLCKASVARKILALAWRHRIALERSAIHRIDADLHFDAAVDAVLLIAHFAPEAHDPEANVYPNLNATTPQSVIGYEDGQLVANMMSYQRWKHLCGEEVIKWRSGIKHDCSKVMELKREGGKYRNGLGELVEMEDKYLYPMLKSSHVAKGTTVDKNRVMLVTQRKVGENTAVIQKTAPRTWEYLVAHADLLNKRGSSIYRNRPAFSIFGVGAYTFAPWKVAISGFYKKLAFAVVGQTNDKPIVLDDTSYFLPCRTQEQADYLAALLNSPEAQEFYRAFVFWDAKRPITADLLLKLDLRLLSKELGVEDAFNAFCRKPDRELLLW